jgi:hypothetical protein
MRRRVMLLVCTVLCLSEVPPLVAQIEARQGVARLPWHDPNAGGIRGTVQNFDALWRPNFHADHFMAGWNWGASERELSEPLVMPVHHIGDEWITDRDLDDAYQRRHLPGRVLIPRIRGLGTENAQEPERRDTYICPNESIALEFVPFLVWDQATERMTLVASDATGSVFGFREHALGVTVPALPTPQTTPQPQPGSVDYRWRLEATQVTGRTPVLSDVWPDRELRVFGNTATDDRAGDRVNHNTTEMFVSVTVRRTSDANPVDEAAHANDEVLRITIPYWMGVIDGTQITGNIRFRLLTDANDPVNDHVVEGIVVGRRRDVFYANPAIGPATEEFIITRGMLPLAALNQDVTIEAGVCGRRCRRQTWCTLPADVWLRSLWQ